MPQHLNHMSPRRKRRKKKKKRPWENTWDNSWKRPKIGEGNNHTSPRNPESPKQDKTKVKHPKAHINQINKDQTQRTNIKSSKGKTTNRTQGDSHKDNSWSSNRNSSCQEGMAGHTENDERKKTYSPDYCTQQESHSNMKEKSKALWTSKSWENSVPPNQLSNKCQRIFSRQETQKLKRCINFKWCINSNPKQQRKWQWDHT